jgi:hypothetical protein
MVVRVVQARVDGLAAVGSVSVSALPEQFNCVPEQVDTSAKCVPFIFSSSLFDNVHLLLMHADRA